MKIRSFIQSKAKTLRVFDALQDENFRLLWWASWMWYHARWVEVTVLGWVVLVLTDSPFLVGLVGFFRMIPMPILGVIAGMVADRANRRYISLGAQVVNIVSVAMLLLTLIFDFAEYWHIAMMTLTMGIAWTFDFPARRSVITDLVGTHRVVNAMSMDMAAMTGSKMMGPILGGALLATTSAEAAIFLLLIFYVFGAALLLRVHFPERQLLPEQSRPLKMIAEGFSYIRTNPVMLGVIVVTVIANMLLFPFVLMVPVFARDVLEIGPGLMGILMAADGFGSMIGAVYLASRDPRDQGKIFVLGTTVAMGLVLGFSFSTVFGFSLLILFLEGLVIAGFGTMQSAITLTVTPVAMRGRAMGVVMMAIGASPIGILITGAVAEVWGAPVAIAINSTVALIAMVAVILGVPALRRFNFGEEKSQTNMAVELPMG